MQFELNNNKKNKSIIETLYSIGIIYYKMNNLSHALKIYDILNFEKEANSDGNSDNITKAMYSIAEI